MINLDINYSIINGKSLSFMWSELFICSDPHILTNLNLCKNFCILDFNSQIQNVFIFSLKPKFFKEQYYKLFLKNIYL